MQGRFPVTKQGLAEALGFLADAAVELGVDDSAATRSAVIVDELVSNLLRHDPTLGPGDDFTVWIAREGDALTVSLEDNGQPFDPTAFRHVERPEIGGRGIDLIRGLSREMSYVRERGVNRTRMIVDPR